MKGSLRGVFPDPFQPWHANDKYFERRQLTKPSFPEADNTFPDAGWESEKEKPNLTSDISKGLRVAAPFCPCSLVPQVLGCTKLQCRSHLWGHPWGGADFLCL